MICVGCEGFFHLEIGIEMENSVNFVDENYDEKYALTTFLTKTRLRRDENRPLQIKTMTTSILTFVDERRRGG